jgi:hypothetical protein
MSITYFQYNNYDESDVNNNRVEGEIVKTVKKNRNINIPGKQNQTNIPRIE